MMLELDRKREGESVLLLTKYITQLGISLLVPTMQQTFLCRPLIGVNKKNLERTPLKRS